jgi:phage gp36-like protein
MFITKNELSSHMHIETVDVITGGDDTLVDAAIDGAVAEAKGYLSDFDTGAIFNATGESRHPLLVTFVKDIAVWHLVALSNYNADIELREKRYNRAVEWLKAVQKGLVVPDLPRTDDAGCYPIIWGSNPKRNQHF